MKTNLLKERKNIISAPSSAAHRNRRVFSVEELTDAQVVALEKAEVPADYAHLDRELTDDLTYAKRRKS